MVSSLILCTELEDVFSSMAKEEVILAVASRLNALTSTFRALTSLLPTSPGPPGIFTYTHQCIRTYMHKHMLYTYMSVYIYIYGIDICVCIYVCVHVYTTAVFQTSHTSGGLLEVLELRNPTWELPKIWGRNKDPKKLDSFQKDS